MNKKAYKVARRAFGRFYSATRTTMPWHRCLEYVIGERTVPDIGRVFVFKTIEDAKLFIGINIYSYVIMEGIAENVGFPRFLCNFYNLDEIDCYWKLKDKKKKLKGAVSLDKAPNGTLSCSAFTPEKFVT